MNELSITSMRTYDSVLVARYMLSLAFEKRIALNVTKVQKLLFMLYGFFLAKYNERIIDEAPKAWPYGPVFPNTRKKVDYGNILDSNDPCFSEIKADKPLNDMLNIIIDNYSSYTASQLSDWSHMKGSPWEITTKQEDFDWNTPISDDLIKAYFSEFKLN